MKLLFYYKLILIETVESSIKCTPFFILLYILVYEMKDFKCNIIIFLVHSISKKYFSY